MSTKQRKNKEETQKSSSQIIQNDVLQNVQIISHVSEPELFLNPDSSLTKKTLSSLKTVYDYTKNLENNSILITKSLIKNSTKIKKSKSIFSQTEAPLKSLIIDEFDSEQIWQELQLQNTLLYDCLVSSVSQLIATSSRVQNIKKSKSNSNFIKTDHEVTNFSKSSHVHFEESDVDEDSLSENGEDKNFKRTDKSKKYRKTVVDDKFFKLGQMEEFLEEMEKDQNKADDDEEIDLFDSNDESEEGENSEDDAYYKDFFDAPLDENSTKNPGSISEEEGGFSSDSESSEGGNEGEISEDKNEIMVQNKDVDGFLLPEEKEKKEDLSTFEKRKKKVEESIEKMEKEALDPKGWQFQGEINAQKRPENSLLEEYLQFDHMLKPAPEITVEVTQKLEDIIKQRIKDQAWDDVERKAKPIENASEYKNKLIMDSEKSKLSLAQIYEQDYVNQKKAEETKVTLEESAPPEEEENIRKELNVIFRKLDALSNFYYTPKPPSAKVKVVTNLPSISLEEAVPVTVSDATLLAPQEISAPSKGEIKSTEERSTTDKKRERRLKKKKQHLRRIKREEKSKISGLGLRNVKQADSLLKKKLKKGEIIENSNNKELKSSKAFFNKLQTEAQVLINKKRAKKEVVKDVSAKKFKM